jgi:hypothetical protein
VWVEYWTLAKNIFPFVDSMIFTVNDKGADDASTGLSQPYRYLLLVHLMLLIGLSGKNKYSPASIWVNARTLVHWWESTLLLYQANALCHRAAQASFQNRIARPMGAENFVRKLEILWNDKNNTMHTLARQNLRNICSLNTTCWFNRALASHNWSASGHSWRKNYRK